MLQRENEPSYATARSGSPDARPVKPHGAQAPVAGMSTDGDSRRRPPGRRLAPVVRIPMAAAPRTGSGPGGSPTPPARSRIGSTALAPPHRARLAARRRRPGDVVGDRPAPPPLRSELGLTKVESGWLVASFSIAVVAVAIPIGHLADRIGARRVVAAGGVAMAAATLGLGSPGRSGCSSPPAPSGRRRCGRLGGRHRGVAARAPAGSRGEA